MACTTTCPLCRRCYEEVSEEEANNPNRMCTACYRERYPTALDIDFVNVREPHRETDAEKEQKCGGYYSHQARGDKY